MHFQTDDVRIEGLRPLLAPAILMEEFVLDDAGAETVAGARRDLGRILSGEDKRLAVVVGPCSIHDTAAGIEYAQRLAELAGEVKDSLCVVMRVYFEKPRTTVGWKGLINDPHLDGSFDINSGLRSARKFLIDVTALGLPIGSEFLDPIMPQFLADVVSWGAIGARTSESQVHRELASGLSMPVGFKNGTNGDVQIALDAIRSSAHPHHFLSVTKQGVAAIVTTRGNDACHLILRGGSKGPNYGHDDIETVIQQLEGAQLAPRLMVDCSHANSQKDHRRQVQVSKEVASDIAAGNHSIFGVMVESFLEEGNQKHPSDQELLYGQSITDECIGWERTRNVVHEFAEASSKRNSD
ncbi:MAG: 3-deoxy-7-phosphoheptulonate synthase [Candidatus Paceibacteria bacterium]|jgi:3-deoxy-7-phosphoheptulonate synthase